MVFFSWAFTEFYRVFMASAVLLPSFTLFPLPFWIPPMATGLPDGGSWLVTELLPGFGQLLMRSKV